MPRSTWDSVASELVDLEVQVEAHINEASDMLTEIERAQQLMKNSQTQYVRLCALVDRADELRRAVIRQRDAVRQLSASIVQLRRSLR